MFGNMDKEVFYDSQGSGLALLDNWQEAAGAGEDGLRKLLERVVQQVLEMELAAFLEVEPHERTAEGKGYRSG